MLYQGESPTYILNEDTNPAIRAIRVSHSLHIVYTSFDEMIIFDLIAGVYYYFFLYNNVLFSGMI